MTAVLENYYHCLQNISLAAPSVWPTLRTIIQFVWKLERPPTINITIDVPYTVLTVLLCSLFHSLFIFFSNFTCSFMCTKISLQKFFATVEYWNIIHFVFVLWFIFIGKQICKIVFQNKIRSQDLVFMTLTHNGCESKFQNGLDVATAYLIPFIRLL